MLTIVGAGRIGHALAAMAAAEGMDHAVVRRGEGVPDAAGPIVVCTRNDDIEAAIASIPRPDDLVFVQNGALLPWLAARGLGQCTQGLLYFAVPVVRAPPEAGSTSLFFGRHAFTLAYLLGRGGLPARVLDSEGDLRNEITVKLLWASIFGALGDRDQETVLASAARREEVGALVAELLPVCAGSLGSTLQSEEVSDRILAYSVNLGSWRASVKEWSWRNGWLVAEAARLNLPTPNHTALLARLGR